MRTTLVMLLLAILPLPAFSERPNILWIDIDDQSPWYNVYGDKTVSTPNLDALANEGVVFERAYAASPVCAPSRSAMITGVYPIRAGTHDMRAGRVPDYQIHLPKEITTVPEIMRKAGYETYNAHKDDYNFAYDRRNLYSFGNPMHPYSPGSRDDEARKSDSKKGGYKAVSKKQLMEMGFTAEKADKMLAELNKDRVRVKSTTKGCVATGPGVTSKKAHFSDSCPFPGARVSKR